MARKPQPYRLEPRGKKGILWVRFTAPNGQPVFRSSGTTDRDLATEWASKLHAEHYRVIRLGDKPRRLWTEAVPRWIDGHSKKRSLNKDLFNFRWLDPYLRDKYLDEIDKDLLADLAAKRKAEPRDKRRRKDGTPYTTEPTSQRTVNRMLSLINSVLNDAREWGWIDKKADISIDEEGEDGDYRWLTREEAADLYAELAEHIRPWFQFALATGWREQNVLRLEWSRVDLQRKVAWVQGSQAKAKKAIGAPLNRDAVAILKAQQGKHPRWVFPNEEGKPFNRANNKGFQGAQRRAGIAPVKWHDLRHTWASWHVMAGTSLRSLMELGGWRSYRSVLRYAHLSPEHLAQDAARVEGLAQELHRCRKG